MRRILSVLLILVVLLSVVSADRRQIDTETKKAAEVFNEFGEKVYRLMSRLDGNIFLSPLSIFAVVGMIHLGARGRTAQEIDNILELDKNKINGTELHESAGKLLSSLKPLLKEFDLQIANGVFVNEELQVYVKYKEALEKYYQAGLYSAPLKFEPAEAVKDLNFWVKDQTDGKIETLIERPLPPTIPLVIMNAVYFRGSWVNSFNKTDTKKEDFFGVENVKKTELMHQKNNFIHVDTPRYQAIELPYKGEDVVMVVVLPKDTKDLRVIDQTVSYQEIRDHLSSVIKQKVDLTLPKFSLGTGYNLREPLQEVGLKSLFAGNYANLTGISRDPIVAIDAIYHKALVDVNEEGTTASATTTAIDKHSDLVNPQVAEFKANRPFLFFIEDLPSGAVLFQGRLSEA